MEVWTLINKNDKKLIRFDVIRTTDPEFGTEYFFTTDEYSPIWFVETRNEIEKAYRSFIHPQYRMIYRTPSTDNINIDDYEITKFIIQAES